MFTYALKFNPLGEWFLKKKVSLIVELAINSD